MRNYKRGYQGPRGTSPNAPWCLKYSDANPWRPLIASRCRETHRMTEAYLQGRSDYQYTQHPARCCDATHLRARF